MALRLGRRPVKHRLHLAGAGPYATGRRDVAQILDLRPTEVAFAWLSHETALSQEVEHSAAVSFVLLQLWKEDKDITEVAQHK